MNKIICFVLAVLLTFLCACGSEERQEETASQQPNEVSDSAGQSSEEADADAVPLTESETRAMYSNPNDYKERIVELTGKILSAPEYDNDGVYFQMYADPENLERNTIVMYPDPDIDLNEDDYLRIKGIVSGTYEGKNMIGGIITAPMIYANSLETITYQEAVAPALYTIMSENLTQTQHGYSVSVEKIELAEKETRVYLKVENNGENRFNLYSFNSLIIQNGRQFEEETNYRANYPEVQTDLSVGVTTEGIFCFPAIENIDFQLVLDGRSEDYSEDIEPFVFDIAVA